MEPGNLQILQGEEISEKRPSIGFFVNVTITPIQIRQSPADIRHLYMCAAVGLVYGGIWGMEKRTLWQKTWALVFSQSCETSGRTDGQ